MSSFSWYNFNDNSVKVSGEKSMNRIDLIVVCPEVKLCLFRFQMAHRSDQCLVRWMLFRDDVIKDVVPFLFDPVSRALDISDSINSITVRGIYRPWAPIFWSSTRGVIAPLRAGTDFATSSKRSV